MHELGITCNIVAIVREAANGRKVSRVTLEVGRHSGIMADALAFCFEVVARHTELDGATLDIREVDGHARCLACGAEFAATTLYEPCACGSRRLLLLKGEELKIKTMELEEVD
jgi:hydrogenase nickel incorporation protein HypA/HybF